MKKYTKTEEGIKYIIYDKPIRMKKVDVIYPYDSGGYILYRAVKGDVESVDILAHVKVDQKFIRADISLFARCSFVFSELHPYEIEYIAPIVESEFSLSDVAIMPEKTFYSDYAGKLETIFLRLKAKYGIEEDEMCLIYSVDSKYDCVAYYGYCTERIATKGLPKIYQNVGYNTYDNYLRTKEYVKNTYSDTQIDDTEEDGLLNEVEQALDKERDLPVIVRKIRKWIRSTSYIEFENAIKQMVIGQEELEYVLISIYSYMECIAYGKTCNNNILLAAPSGCGKTETYRAVKAYFKDAIPGLVVYQYDMTHLTEEGFRGKNASSMIEPLKREDQGVGIAFLDEFDKKLVPSVTSGGQNVNLAVQSQILTYIEGTIDEKTKVNTENTMFIGMGAYDLCRAKKSQGEKHMGFGQINKTGEKHYAKITRNDMIELGGCYELIGRFATIINYHELSYEAVDQIIDKMLESEKAKIDCEIEMSDKMREVLHNNANGKFGCRILYDNIHSIVMRGYLNIMQMGYERTECTIIIEDIDSYRISFESDQDSQQNENILG